MVGRWSIGGVGIQVGPVVSIASLAVALEPTVESAENQCPDEDDERQERNDGQPDVDADDDALTSPPLHVATHLVAGTCQKK